MGNIINWQVEIANIVRILREKGNICLKEGHGKIIELVVPEKWEAHYGKQDGIFLISDLFQLRNLAVPFSEVSLDIVELASQPIIYHTIAKESLVNGPVTDHVVKFTMINEGFWNRLLFSYGRPLIYRVPDLQGDAENGVNEKFPLTGGRVREMFLGPEGEVKIING